jgi:hypothetical protein
MAGYSARQSTFTTGDTITAAHSNDEFNQILAAFHVSTGHTHDGTTAGDGGPLSTLFSNTISMGTGADTDVAVTFNANSNDGVITWMEDEDYFQFSDDLLLSTTEKIQFRDTAIYINSSTDGQLDLVADTEIQIAATTVDINGNVDISGSLTLGGTAITSTAAELNIMDGDTSATSTTVADADRVVYNDAGTMKQVAVTDLDTYISATSKTLTNKTLTSPVLNTSVSGTAIADEDDMSSNSATKLATQQSIKAYVDAQITAEDLDVTTDSGTIAIDLDSETLTIAGGTGLDSSATSNTVTLAIDSTVATLTGSQTLTNKTLTSPVLNTGVSGTAVLDEDNMASNSATQLATQQSIKAYVDAVSTGITTFVMEDDDGTEVTISDGKEVKFIGSGLTTNWTDTDNGTDGDPYDLTFTVDAAQTGITSILATDLKIGEDDQTKIDFETADEIHFYAANAEQVYVADGVFGPQTDSDVDLGTTGVRWKDAYVDSVTVTDNVTIGGNLTVNGTTTTVNSTTVTIDDPIFTLGGDSAPGSDDNKDRGIEFRWHNGTAAKVGFFGYDDSASAFTFIPDATNSSEVFSGTAGNVVFGNITGTLQTAAQTNITSVGALDGGSISSNFGAIDVGSSAITTTGTVTGGTLAGTLSTAAQTNITSTGALDGGSITSGFGAIDNGTSGIRTNTFTAETSIVPDASGGADIGSTSLEWGDLYIADDKKIYLGSDQDVSIEYDEDGNDTTAVVAAGGVSMAPHGSSAGNGTELRFQELAANGANYVGFKAPDAIASNEVWVLPNADGSANQVLKTDGSNALSWVDQGGGGEVSLVADGAIAAQKPVILTAAGKAKQIAETTSLADSISINHAQAVTNTTGDLVSSVYDSNSETFSMAFKDTSNSNYGTIVCGTPSNGTVTWGTPVVFESSAIDSQPMLAAGGNRIHVTYYDTSNNNAGIRSASISGTTPTFAAETVFATGSTYNDTKGMHIAYDTSTNYVIVLYQGGTGTVKTWVQAIYHDTSDGTYTAGSATELHAGGLTHTASGIVFDPDTNRTIIAYKDQSNSNYPTANVVQSSGTAGSPTVTIGADTLLNGSSAADDMDIVYDTTNNKAVIFFDDAGGGNLVKAVIGTVTGGGTNTIAVTSPTTIWDPTGNPNYWAAGYDGDKNRIQYFYHDEDSGDDFTYKVITPGASSLSVADGGVLSANQNKMGPGSASFGAGHGVLCATEDSNNSGRISYGMVYFASTTSSNLDNGNYLGVAKASISDTATGTIVIPGGISEGHSSLTIGNHYFTNGNGVIGLVGNTTGEQYVGRAISATEIQLLENEGYLYGTAEGAVTAGKPVFVEADGDFLMPVSTTTTYTHSKGSDTEVVSTNSLQNISTTYAANVDRFVVSYVDGDDGNKPTVKVVSVGSDNAVAVTATLQLSTTSYEYQNARVEYDVTNEKVLYVYNSGDTDNDLRCKVLTVGASSISQGSEVVIDDSNSTGTDINVCYDTTNSKFVVYTRDQSNSNYPTAYVGSISGTTPSFGAAQVVQSEGATNVYDVGFGGDKFLFTYKDSSTSDGQAVAASLSGTTLSFGTKFEFEDDVVSNSSNQDQLTYVEPAGLFVQGYKHNGGGSPHILLALKVASDNSITKGYETGASGSANTNVVYNYSNGAQPKKVSMLTVPIIYRDGSNNIKYNEYVLEEASGENIGYKITKGTEVSLNTTPTNYFTSISQAGAAQNYRMLAAYEDSGNDINAYGIHPAGSITTTTFPTDGKGFVGFATKDVSDNGQVEVATTGQIDAQQSGLTAGETYFAQNDGSLGTSADSLGSVVVGKALSATKLLIQ